jgi:hypothetical protein
MKSIGRRIILNCLLVVLLAPVLSCTSSNEPRVIVQTQVVQSKFPDIYEYDLPESMTLCGETIDLTDPLIREMFDREFTIMVWDRPQVFMWIKRSGRYFPYFEKKLAEQGLPDDLKYLAVAESSLHVTARSHAGANGMWQFMEAASKRYGLRIEKGVIDERLSVERSTDAALKYLKELRSHFDSWMLAIASYNCGENQVNQARKSQSVENYFKLNLPPETERYVFRIAAIKMILEDPVKFGYKIDAERKYKPLDYRTVNVNISGRFYITDLMAVADINYRMFRELNPKILSSTLPQGRYSVHVPSESKDDFIDALEKLSDPDFRSKHGYDKRFVVVKEGDVLYTISWRTGVSVGTIMRLNNLKNANISPGQRLLIRE